MFMGHYAPAVWLGGREEHEEPIKLWQAFVAVQAIDIVFCIMAIFGLEGSLIENGDPVFNIPWSHSLLSSILISGFVGLAFIWWKKPLRWKAFWVMSSLVFSHWLMDFIVHRPDLPLYPGAEEVYGLGFWNFPWLAYVLEIGLLFVGFIYWVRATTPRRKLYKIAPWVLFVLMCGMQFGAITLPGLHVQNGTFDPASQPQGVFLGISGLVTFFALSVAISWIENGRDFNADQFSSA